MKKLILLLSFFVILANAGMAKEPRLTKKHYRKAKMKTEQMRGRITDEVKAYLDYNQGDTDDEKRVNLPVLRKCVASVVDICNDVSDRVDGYLMQRILERQVDNRIDKLPVIAEETD